MGFILLKTYYVKKHLIFKIGENFIDMELQLKLTKFHKLSFNSGVIQDFLYAVYKIFFFK